MNNVSHLKKLNLGMIQVHVEPPTIPLMKGKYDGKSDKDFVKMKLRRDTTSSIPNLYGFRMYLFNKGDME